MNLALRRLIKNALAEDKASHDVTSRAIFKKAFIVNGYLTAKESMILSGLGVACETFKLLDKSIAFISGHADGAKLKAGERFAKVTGRAATVLAAERVALNFLQHLCGIATLTSRYVEKTKGTRAKVLDTRKTLPGLRELEKKAVVHGGGKNHRMNLSDQYLIKDNHIAACGGVGEAVRRVEQVRRVGQVIEVEITELSQLEEAIAAGADIVLLDNMPLAMIRKAVKLARGSVLLEVSGGVTLDNVRDFAKTGVDRISVGRLTHSAPAADISLEILT